MNILDGLLGEHAALLTLFEHLEQNAAQMELQRLHESGALLERVVMVHSISEDRICSTPCPQPKAASATSCWPCGPSTSNWRADRIGPTPRNHRRGGGARMSAEDLSTSCASILRLKSGCCSRSPHVRSARRNSKNWALPGSVAACEKLCREAHRPGHVPHLQNCMRGDTFVAQFEHVL